MAPGIDPMPPSTTMHTTNTDSMKVNDSGLMNCPRSANVTPAMPPHSAPSENAHSFVRRDVDAARDAAATSSSRIATHARPSRESSSRRMTKTVTRHSSTMTKYQNRSELKTKSPNGVRIDVVLTATAARPGGGTSSPRARQTRRAVGEPEVVVRGTMRTISPNPSVTIAR